MKKIFNIILLFCIMAAALVGCEKEPATPKNEITPKELTQEQEDIVSLLSSNKQEILLFDYKTEDVYKSMEYWVEVYENGELIDRPSGINSSYGDEAKPINGQVAILINHDSGISWTFTTREDGTRVSHTGETLNIDSSTLACAYGSISTPVTIESGKEIVLYTSIYSTGNSALYSDMQIYIDEPELLSSYPYVHIIKFKFTK